MKEVIHPFHQMFQSLSIYSVHNGLKIGFRLSRKTSPENICSVAPVMGFVTTVTSLGEASNSTKYFPHPSLMPSLFSMSIELPFVILPFAFTVKTEPLSFALILRSF